MALVAFVSLADGAPDLSPEARSDAFWASLWVNGREAEHYRSLDDMTASADLVVVGRIAEVAEGRVFVDAGTGDAAYYALATLVIEQHVSGDTEPAEEATSIDLELFMTTPDLLEGLRATHPGERSLFFLRDKYVEATFLELPPELRDAEAGYYRLVSTQGLLRDWDRVVEPPVGAEDQFLLDLAGSDFDTLVAELSAAH